MIPDRLTSPTVGLIPTMPFELAGHRIEPSVSVPTAPAARSAETATADPELDPQGLRSSAYGLRHCPPRALHPLVERVERKFAHSDRFALPKIDGASRTEARHRERVAGRLASSSAREPAVVRMRPGRLQVVLHEDRDPVERTARPGGARSASNPSASPSGVGVRLDHGVERGVERLDPPQVRLRDRPRGQFSGGHLGGELAERHLEQAELLDGVHRAGPYTGASGPAPR